MCVRIAASKCEYCVKEDGSLSLFTDCRSSSIPKRTTVNSSIQEANKAVRNAPKRSKSRGKYSKYKPEQQAQVAKYAVEFGIQAAVRRFSKDFGVDLKKSTIRSWKAKYLTAELPAVLASLPHGTKFYLALPWLYS